MAFLRKHGEKIDDNYLYEFSGDEDDRLRLEYVIIFHSNEGLRIYDYVKNHFSRIKVFTDNSSENAPFTISHY